MSDEPPIAGDVCGFAERCVGRVACLRRDSQG